MERESEGEGRERDKEGRRMDDLREGGREGMLDDCIYRGRVREKGYQCLRSDVFLLSSLFTCLFIW